MLRICLFCRYFYPHVGGNETQAMNLALELINNGHKVMIVTGKPDETYKDYEFYKGMHIYRVKFYSIYKVYSLFVNIFRRGLRSDVAQSKMSITSSSSQQTKTKSLFRQKVVKINEWVEHYTFMIATTNFLKKHKGEIDLIHSQMLYNFGYMALRAGKMINKPVLIKDASLGGLAKVNLQPKVLSKREFLRKNGYFVAVSTQIAENFQSQGIEKSRIAQIYNGIDITEIDKRNNDNAYPETILYVGNFYQGEIKGLDILIMAMSKVVVKFPSVILNVAGKGDIDFYKTLAKQYGCENNINFLGSVSDTSSLYRNNAIFVLPSRQEGMSNAVLEAMSYGMPCVITDVSGARDQIEDRLEGLVVPIGNFDVLADALSFMLANPQEAKHMGSLAKRKIIKCFDMKVIARQIINIYRKLLSDKDEAVDINNYEELNNANII